MQIFPCLFEALLERQLLPWHGHGGRGWRRRLFFAGDARQQMFRAGSVGQGVDYRVKMRLALAIVIPRSGQSAAIDRVAYPVVR